jgi:hypothetical protein
VKLLDQLRAAIPLCEEPFDARELRERLPFEAALFCIQQCLHGMKTRGQLRVVEVQWSCGRKNARYAIGAHFPMPQGVVSAEAGAKRLDKALNHWKRSDPAQAFPVTAGRTLRR